MSTPNYFLHQSAKRSLILILHNNFFEMGKQRMASNTIALNAKHSTIQQFHVEFCCLMKKNLNFMNINIEKATK
jgi:hypothetical protein